MTFSLRDFAVLRPFLYHVMARENLPVVKAVRVLWSAAELARRSGRAEILGGRRLGRTEVRITEGSVVLRDQAPLYTNHVAFEGGWSAEDLLRALNERVFFWPGGEAGPIDYGCRHAAKYADTDVVIRLPFRDVAAQGPTFCRYNSGSPRTVDGRKSPRGPDTFLPVEYCDYPPGKVVEVTYVDELRLPESTQWAGGLGERWRLLFGV